MTNLPKNRPYSRISHFATFATQASLPLQLAVPPRGYMRTQAHGRRTTKFDTTQLTARAAHRICRSKADHDMKKRLG